MELKTILKRYPVFILGLYFLSLGIVLIVRSALGTTPISSINYVLSINSALSLGTWNISSRSVFTRQKKIRSWAIRSCSSEIFPVKML